MISSVCDLVGDGNFSEAAALIALLPHDDRPGSEETLLRAAVAPTAEDAVQLVAAGIDRDPADQRLLRALASVNAWLSDRLDRQAFAIACTALLLPAARGSAETAPVNVLTAADTRPEALRTTEGGTLPADDASPSRPLDALWTAAAAALFAGELDAAIRHLDAIVAIDPHNANALEQLVQLQADTGQWHDAARTNQRLVAERPDDHNALANQVVLLLRAGQREQALAVWRQLPPAAADRLPPITEPSDPAAAVMQQANDALRSGDGPAAYALFRQVLAVRAEDAAAYAGAAKALALQGRFDDALVSARFAQTLAPDDSGVAHLIEALAARTDAPAFAFLRR